MENNNRIDPAEMEDLARDAQQEDFRLPLSEEDVDAYARSMGEDGPAVGTYAHTACIMARMFPVEGDADFWDRWKDEMKEG